MYDLQDLSVHPLPRLVRWIFGYVAVLFATNFAIVKYLYSGKTVFIDEEKYDKKRDVWEVATRLVSAVNAFFMVYLSSRCYFFDPVLKADPVWARTENSFATCTLGMGTFLYDTVIVFVRDHKIKSYNAEKMPVKLQELQSKLAQTNDSEEKEAFQKELDKIYRHDFSKTGQAKGISRSHMITVVLHHVACVLVCAAGVFSGTFGYHAAGVEPFLGEISGAFVNGLFLLPIAGFKENTLVYKINAVLMLILFVFTRAIIVHSYMYEVLALTYEHWPRLVANPSSLGNPLGFFIVYIIGLYWVYLLFKKMKRLILRSKSRKKSSAASSMTCASRGRRQKTLRITEKKSIICNESCCRSGPRSRRFQRSSKIQ